MDKIVIWGAGGHARVIADIIRLSGNYEIIGFIDSVNRERWDEKFCGAVILGGEEKIAHFYSEGVRNLFVAIGDCTARSELSLRAESIGFTLPILQHPNSVIATDVLLTKGTVIMAGAVINSGTCIGANVIINTSAIVDHECDIGDSVHISPGAKLGGEVQIGKKTWIGIGATVRDKIHIGRSTVIGAGAVVVSNIPNNVLAYGIPAKIQQSYSNER